MDELRKAFQEALDNLEKTHVPMSYEEARQIVDSAEVVNAGTECEFVRGMYSQRFQDAMLTIAMHDKDDSYLPSLTCIEVK